MSILGKRLKQLREDKKKVDSKFTQGYVAKLIGVARVTYTAYENGTKQPPFETVNKLADIFDVSTDFLHGRIDQPYPEPLLTVTGPTKRSPYKGIGMLISTMVSSRNISNRLIMDLLKIDNEQLIQLYAGEIAPTERQAELLATLLETKKEKFLPQYDEVTVGDKKIELTPEEIKVFEELKKHPVLFHDLATNPEKKVKELIKLYKMKKMFLEDEDEEYGEGFGDIED